MRKSNIKPVPEGYHTLTPSLMVRDAVRAIEFYEQAFGAQERYRLMTPDNKWVAHAELKIGDSIIMLAEEMPGYELSAPASAGTTSVSFYVYVEDVDTAFQRAVDAGATVKMDVQNSFWGDRIGQVIDPSGHLWTLATHVEEVSPEEIAARGHEEFEKMLQEAGQR